MKIREILTESADYRKLQNIIYDYVFKHAMSSLPTAKRDMSAIDDARKLALTTDEFWVDAFDEAIEAFVNPRFGVQEIEDALAQAIEAVSEKVHDFYKNPMNHPPGFKIVNVPILNYENVAEKELLNLIDKIDPQLMKKIKDEQEEEIKKHKEARAQAKASLTKDKLEELAAFIKKNDAAGWKKFFSVINGRHKKNTFWADDYIPKGLTEKDVDAAKTPEELKEICEKALVGKSNKEYVLTVYYNLDSLDLFGKNEREMSNLNIAARDGNISNRLVKLLGL